MRSIHGGTRWSRMDLLCEVNRRIAASSIIRRWLLAGGRSCASKLIFHWTPIDIGARQWGWSQLCIGSTGSSSISVKPSTSASFLTEGRTGLGFGVGHEPLPALFASLGCTHCRYRSGPGRCDQGRVARDGQHADGLAALERPEICAPATFRERVSFEVVDMNDIPAHLRDRFDFCWSACCLEHLGSLAHGLRFIENSLNTLKIGGVGCPHHGIQPFIRCGHTGESGSFDLSEMRYRGIGQATGASRSSC